MSVGGSGDITLDLSSIDALKASPENVQFQVENMSRVNVSGGVMTISMQPNDSDNNSGNPKDNRRRNEIIVKGETFSIAVGERGTWSCYIRLNQDITWGKNFYHIIQVKGQARNTNPMFTVSLYDNHVAVSGRQSPKSIIMPISAAVGKWIPMTVSVHNTPNGEITYTVDGQSGTFSMPGGDEPQTDLNFKCGQYRKITSDEPTFATSTSYRNISFEK